MKYFGFFKGMKYGKCEDDFEAFKAIENQLDKSKVLKYIKGLPIAGIAPMSIEDIFTGEPIEQAGIVEDGEYCIFRLNSALFPEIQSTLFRYFRAGISA